ncbi:ankyrin repeat protein, putative [Trichomonas vaginalis G3]|uniref:Ankyrin repeat protein, putative n=1 Tax=Trichomonas vaginalis (strain ATCC PRA-98 / G3) TaxID=412133 RepID=A2EEB1_TRIV3|nr:spectrin binding [Trichomonas vaginalis G3]EAY09009.1 ankyrin repeat protein, putative [Trichomonas vaginalis G3]KAI5496282.1 spectrin binding [Trichomonas vaginalis G3]|eukprot:XP_001321232.1 ankyrin repeat protein [Trichomonas vaginalis G3]
MNSTETTLFLIEKGADINQRSDDGKAPFLSACYADDFVLVKIFIELGVDANSKDEKGANGLMRNFACNEF